MATRDALPTPVETGAFNGTCWVLPPHDVEACVDQINHLMQQTVVGKIGERGIFLISTGLLLQDRQIIVILTHGGQANLFVCDSMQVNQ